MSEYRKYDKVVVTGKIIILTPKSYTYVSFIVIITVQGWVAQCMVDSLWHRYTREQGSRGVK